MAASITLSSLSFALVDGRVLFSDLNFRFNTERTGLIGRNGAGEPVAGRFGVSRRISLRSGRLIEN